MTDRSFLRLLEAAHTLVNVPAAEGTDWVARAHDLI